VILMHEKLLRHFDPDIERNELRFRFRIVQERSCQGPGENAGRASKRVEV